MTTRSLTASLRTLALAGPLLLASIGLPGTADAAVTVDCSKAGQTIGKKIQPTAKLLEIVVKGNCVENLAIDRDDVVITASGPASITAADPARPAIELDGAKRIAIDGLVISGGAPGVLAGRGSSLDLLNCVVQGNGPNGVAASSGSAVSVDGCTIQNNGGTGAVAANGATLAITNSAITGHATGSGVAALRSANVRVGQSFSGALGAVTISGNAGGVGLSVTENSAGILVGGAVSNNGRGGVFVGRGSGALIGIGSSGGAVETTIEGNQGIGITVDGSNAIVVATRVINNTSFGIHLTDGATGRFGMLPGGAGIARNTISGNGATGVDVNGSHVTMAGNDITGNGTNPAVGSRYGVSILGGHVQMPGENTISNHPVWGMVVSTGGHAVIGSTGFAGVPSTRNTISGNGTDASFGLDSRGGMVVRVGSAVGLDNARIADNLGTGLLVIVNSTVDLDRTTVENNTGNGVWLAGQSYLRADYPSAFKGNGEAGLRLVRGAAAEFFGYTGFVDLIAGNALGLNCFNGNTSVWSQNNYWGFVSGNAAQNGTGNCPAI